MSTRRDLAKMLATEKHAGQRYGILPYTHHLEDVERTLREFGAVDGRDDDILDAAWLHDIVEDTDVKIRDVLEIFGPEVAHLVGAVTNEPGENRKVRTALTYPKIHRAGSLATRLKLADRISNMRRGGGSLKMYVNEHQEFARQLRVAGENMDMWNALDALVAGVT